MNCRHTAVIDREYDYWVALCPKLDIAGQGCTVKEARESLVEALERFARLLPTK
jgi:predicted RNase H-like HicB family nuclease